MVPITVAVEDRTRLATAGLQEGKLVINAAAKTT